MYLVCITRCTVSQNQPPPVLERFHIAPGVRSGRAPLSTLIKSAKGPPQLWSAGGRSGAVVFQGASGRCSGARAASLLSAEGSSERLRHFRAPLPKPERFESSLAGYMAKRPQRNRCRCGPLSPPGHIPGSFGKAPACGFEHGLSWLLM